MLIGRAAEWGVVEAMLTRAGNAEGGVLLVRGEAGLGKTALLDEAAGLAGPRTLRATGVEVEAELPYATVHQLLGRLLPQLDAIPAVQAEAVRVALGLADGGTPDRFLVALGLLSLLSDAAREQPLLLVVDDLQWCDRASVDALFFMGRRLAAEPVALLMAVREEPGSAAELPGGLAGAPPFPELRLPGLDAPATAELVEQALGVRPDLSVAATMALGTGGNPLAVLELARRLDGDQLAGSRSLPEVLPVGGRLGRAYLDRAEPLDDAGMDLLLLTAVEESGELELLLSAASPPDPVATVSAVEETSLAREEGGRFVLAHPLVRSTLLQAATVARRVDAHRRLAEVLVGRGEADRALWHRAAASLGPDEALATELDDLALRSRRRSGHAAASAAHERAAARSGSVSARARRLVDAADEAWFAGDPLRARALLDRVDKEGASAVDRARLLHLRARAASRRGEVRLAHHLLLDGAALVGDLRPALALEMYAEAVEGAAYAGDLGRLREVVALAERVEPGEAARERFLAAWLRVGNASLQGSLARDAGLLERVLALGEQLDEPRLVVWAGIASLNLGDVAAMQRCYRRALELARATGAVGTMPYALEHYAMSQALAGAYPAARSAAEEGLTLALETEQDRSASHLHAILAFVAGTLGDDEVCARHAAHAREIAVPLALGLPVATAAWAVARADLAAARYGAAVDRLLPLAGAPPEAGHPVVALWSTPDLVEAAVRARRSAEVLEQVERLEWLAAVGGRPAAGAAAAWCRGLLGGPDAEERLTGAAELFGAGGLPLAEGRIRLALGELLRRERRPRDARDHLRAAAEIFGRLGATRWAERAESELRASGEAPPSLQTNGLASLTPQELQIVRLVAAGASNREVAGQLFLSPRTVEYHLYKAYPKLGVSSRTQLVGALAGEPELTGG